MVSVLLGMHLERHHEESCWGDRVNGHPFIVIPPMKLLRHKEQQGKWSLVDGHRRYTVMKTLSVEILGCRDDKEHRGACSRLKNA